MLYNRAQGDTAAQLCPIWRRSKYSYMSYFSVKTAICDAKGTVAVDTLALKCSALQMAPGFKLKDEDPAVFVADDREHFNPKRQWPKIPLPKVSATSSEEVPVAPSMDPAKLKKALAIHHLHVDWLKSMGVDPCKEYQATQVSNLVEAVMPDDRICPVCGDDLSSAVRLRGHLRSKHMESTPFQCMECKKFFGDKQTLVYHEKGHVPSELVHVCEECGKAFAIKSRLTEHKKVHLPENINQPCSYCGKTFKERKNLKSHERRCSENPNKDPKIQCAYCPKDFGQNKDLRRHCKNIHPGKEPKAVAQD